MTRRNEIKGDEDIDAYEAGRILGMHSTSVYGLDGTGEKHVFSRKRCEKLARKRARRAEEIEEVVEPGAEEVQAGLPFTGDPVPEKPVTPVEHDKLEQLLGLVKKLTMDAGETKALAEKAIQETADLKR